MAKFYTGKENDLFSPNYRVQSDFNDLSTFWKGTKNKKLERRWKGSIARLDFNSCLKREKGEIQSQNNPSIINHFAVDDKGG